MNEKTINLIVRIGAGAILIIATLCMFVVNPHVNQDAFSSETLWEAVHPFNWFFDSVALLALIFFGLYVGGMAGKVIYTFTGPRTQNSSGLIHIIGIVCALLTVLFFV